MKKSIQDWCALLVGLEPVTRNQLQNLARSRAPNLARGQVQNLARSQVQSRVGKLVALTLQVW